MLKIIKFNRVLVFGLILCLGLIVAANSCQFRMTDSEVNEYFNNQFTVSIIRTKVEGINLRYLWMDNGQHTTVVFVHGAPGSATEFISYFKENRLIGKFNLLSLDRPGYGFSDFGNFKVSLKDQAKCLAAITKAHQLDNIILVGHSLGAPIAASVALDYPELFHALMIVGGSVDPDLEPMEWYRSWLRNGLGQALVPTALYGTNEEIYHLKEQLEKLKPNWSKLNIPLLVIHGENDKLVPHENITFLENHIQPENIEVWLLPDVDHFIPWKRTDLMIDGILKLNQKL